MLDVHAVALSTQPGTQVDDEFDDIEPVGFGTSLIAFDRNAGRIDDVALEVLSLQRATDPERVLAGFIADGDPYVGGQRPLPFVGLDQVQHCLQTSRGLRLRDGVDGRGRRAPEYRGHGPDTRTLQMQARNDEALFRLKLLVLSSFVQRNTLYETVLHFRFEVAQGYLPSLRTKSPGIM
ncbi:hypothetical protein B0G73_1605 [Paraburkholderia sp. BL25I1N1]|nr:hypothetical protein B0G73_1605 [Paraburkholderia sp. BL25I1N1]